MNESSESFFTTAQNSNLRLGRDFTNTRKFPLNRATRRNFAKNISRIYHTISNPINLKEPLVELHKYMARPPGCSFLGATVAHVPVTINSPTENLSDIIIDSGSDITLISMNTLNALVEVPKIKKGQKINLVQVTGKASISGYVELDLYFRTKEGPVKIKYSLSVKKIEGKLFLEFGDSGQRLDIANSVSPEFVDEEGHTFKI